MLEVLVAFVILALVGTTLFRLFSGALGNAAAAEDYSRAILVAETALAEAAGTPPLREGTKSGTLDDGRIEWKTTITPYDSPPASTDANAGANANASTNANANPNPAANPLTDTLPIRLWRVDADVTFTSTSGKPRTLTLSTVRLGAKDSMP